MRAPKIAWVVLLSLVAAFGAALLILANVISGQHAHGNWVQPAKLIGGLLLGGSAGSIAWLLVPVRASTGLPSGVQRDLPSSSNGGLRKL